MHDRECIERIKAALSDPCGVAARLGLADGARRQAGGLHVKVTHLVAEGNGWRKELTPATVLPGAWRQWTLEGAAASPAIAVTAQTTAGTLTLQLPTRAQ